MKTYRGFLKSLLRTWGGCATAALLVAMLAFPAGAWAQDVALDDSPVSSSDQSVVSLGQDGATTQDEGSAARNGNEPQGEITILHTNDIHGYYTLDARNGSIGFPILQFIRNQIEPDLLLDAGQPGDSSKAPSSFAATGDGNAASVAMLGALATVAAGAVVVAARRAA